MLLRTSLGLAIALGVFGFAPAVADVPTGLWQAAPDARGTVMHVRTRPCGSALCGRIERAKDRRGYDTPSRAVGHSVLRDMRLQEDGSYLGELLAPGSSRLRSARLRVSGPRMELESCDGTVCAQEVWTRLQ